MGFTSALTNNKILTKHRVPKRFAYLAIFAGGPLGDKGRMDHSVRAVDNQVKLAQLQYDAIEPLLKNARLVLLNSAMPEAGRTPESQKEVDEAAAFLAQAILLLDHKLRKVIDKEKVLGNGMVGRTTRAENQD